MRRMRGRLSRLRPSPAIVVSALAVFLTLGGIGYAASKIDTNDIKTGAVTKKKLHKNAVTSKKVKNHSLKCKDMKFDCPVAAEGTAGGPGETGAPGTPGAPGTAGTAGPGQAFGFSLDNTTGNVNGGVWDVRFRGDGSGNCDQVLVSNLGTEDGLLFRTEITDGGPTDTIPIAAGDDFEFNPLNETKYELDLVSPQGVKEVTFVNLNTPDGCVIVGT